RRVLARLRRWFRRLRLPDEPRRSRGNDLRAHGDGSDMPTSSSLNRLLVLSSLLLAGTAFAEDQRPAPDRPTVRPPTYVYTPGAARPPGSLGVTSRLVYLHRCNAGNCYLTPGP